MGNYPSSLADENQKLKRELEDLKFRSSHGGSGIPHTASSKQHNLYGLLCKVSHIALVCADAERSRKFYQDVLGFDLLQRPNFPNPGFWFWMGNVQLHLIQGANAKDEAQHSNAASTGNVNHISLETPNFDATKEALTQANIPFKRVNVPEGDGIIHQLFLTDPDGHYLEICDCQQFENFVFNIKEKDGKKKIVTYTEGIEPDGAVLASIIGLMWGQNTQGFKAGSEAELNECLERLRKAFLILSDNKDHVAVKDFDRVLTRMGMKVSEDEMKDLLKEIDVEQDGDIRMRDILKFAAGRLSSTNSAEEILEAFSVMDRDNSGTISKDELYVLLFSLGQRIDLDELDEIYANVDTDNNNAIDMSEFLGMVEKMQLGNLRPARASATISPP